MAGHVVVADHRIDKPGARVPADAPIRIKNPPAAYVGRGGDKLEQPLAVFQVPVAGAVALDVGASTGGFSDCLLQHGARLVYAVDVGYGQLAWKLQQDPRVVRMDRTNVRDLRPGDLVPPPGLVVIDASFISLKKLLPHVLTLAAEPAAVLCLVKPQFEAPRQAVQRGGIVRERAQYHRVVREVVLTARALGMLVAGIIESPVRGRKGNREFFLYALAGWSSARSCREAGGRAVALANRP